MGHFFKKNRPAYAGILRALKRRWNIIPTPFFRFTLFRFYAFAYATSVIALYAATLCALTILPRKASRDPTLALEFDAS